MLKVGDKVKFSLGNGALAVGTITEHLDTMVIVVEEYAASIWGESRAKAGTVHRLFTKNVELVGEPRDREGFKYLIDEEVLVTDDAGEHFVAVVHDRVLCSEDAPRYLVAVQPSGFVTWLGEHRLLDQDPQ